MDIFENFYKIDNSKNKLKLINKYIFIFKLVNLLYSNRYKCENRKFNIIPKSNFIQNFK